MADTLALRLNAYIDWSYEDTQGTGVGSITDAGTVEYIEDIADGTGSTQADIIWRIRDSVGANSDDDIDVNSLTVTMFGSIMTVGIQVITGILLINHNTTAGDDITLNNFESTPGNAHTALFNGSTTGEIECPADSVLMLTSKTDGWASGSTKKDLVITEIGTSNAVTYTLIIAGRTA